MPEDRKDQEEAQEQRQHGRKEQDRHDYGPSQHDGGVGAHGAQADDDGGDEIHLAVDQQWQADDGEGKESQREERADRAAEDQHGKAWALAEQGRRGGADDI